MSLVAHDWGCVIGFEVERRQPRIVKCVVALDVGRHMAPSIFARIFIFLYQFYIVVAWLVGFLAPAAGDGMIRAMVRGAKVPHPERATCHQGYLYAHYWRALGSGRSAFLVTRTATDPRGLCPFPCLFLYGSPTGRVTPLRFKPVLFHSDAFLFAISKRADSRAMAYDADHWFLVRPELADGVNETVAKWLRERHEQGNAGSVQ